MREQIKKITEEVEHFFEGDSSGHDYWHSIRVYNNAMKIADNEGGDKLIIALASILHDVDDKKLFDTVNYENAINIMSKYEIDDAVQHAVIDVIKDVSYRGTDSVKPASLEGKIVQDADRLDAMGAIGIARTFAYGGNKGRRIHAPNVEPNLCMNGTEYIESEGTSINHFYEKLFMLKEMMNTETAKRIAQKRDSYMHDYLDEFLLEWKGI